MAITNYYIDYSGGSDSTGDGSIGNPYKTLQYALDNVTHDTTNGDQFNLKDNASHVVAGPLNWDIYDNAAGGLPQSPIVIKGYTSAANDGGMATLDGNGNNIVSQGVSVPENYTYWQHIHFTNGGSSSSNWLFDAYNNTNYLIFDTCRFSNSYNACRGKSWMLWLNCHFSSITSINTATVAVDLNIVMGCHFTSGTACYLFPGSMAIVGNLFVGCQAVYAECVVPTLFANNTVIGNSTAGLRGISFRQASTANRLSIINNIFANYTGASAAAIGPTGMNGYHVVYGKNAFYNNTANDQSGNSILLDVGADVLLSSDPFTDAAGGDYSVTDASLKGVGYPGTFPQSSTATNWNIGAVMEAASAAAGGGRKRPWAWGLG